MNDNARKWVAALRSGRFVQGRGSLEYDGRLCCLGVACWVAQENGVKLEISKQGRATTFSGYTVYLPPEVEEWLGLASSSGTYQGGHQKCSLARLNDGLRWDFEKIASFIESEPEGLFKRAGI